MHYAVLVVVDAPDDQGALLEAVGEVLRPFEWEHWDWWQIGGRYTGRLAGEGDPYDPEQDQRNWEVCDLCEGTGTRRRSPSELLGGEDDYGFVVREGFCNGCSSSRLRGLPRGVRVKWPTEWVTNLSVDVLPLGLADKRMKEKGVTFAALVGQGQWFDAVDYRGDVRVEVELPTLASLGEGLRRPLAVVVDVLKPEGGERDEEGEGEMSEWYRPFMGGHSGPCSCRTGPFFDPAETKAAKRRVRIKRTWRRIWNIQRRAQAHRINGGGVK